MASGGSVPSPESTVTSLLASSGRLRSSLHPEPCPTIKYKDRHYESASEALDAYIADFHSSPSFVGQLELSEEQNTPRMLHLGYRNRDVLKESLTDQELDFLKLPTDSECRESDHISVTTNDLLLLPIDGSLPVTRTSAFLSRLENSRQGNSVNSSARYHSRPTGVLNISSGCSSASRTLCVDDLLTGSLKCNRASKNSSSFMATKIYKQRCGSSHQLPRWMTSHKSDMQLSGMSSIPDLKYPPWLEEYDIDVRTQGVPEWVIKLDQNTAEIHEQLKGPEKFRELSDKEELFRGDKIGSLIQRAEDVLKSPSLGFHDSGKEQHGSPGNTEVLLEAERSWDNPPVTFKSPVPVSDTDEQINAEESRMDRKEKSSGSFCSGYSSRKHPGPVEALKQMLFSLQAVEQKVTQEKDETQDISSQPVLELPIQIGGHDEQEVSQTDLENYYLSPGGQSLKRALHHLGRLKNLVDEMNEKREDVQN